MFCVKDATEDFFGLHRVEVLDKSPDSGDFGFTSCQNFMQA